MDETEALKDFEMNLDFRNKIANRLHLTTDAKMFFKFQPLFFKLNHFH